MKENIPNLDRNYAHQLRHWGWPGFFAAMPKRFLLVINADILLQIETITGSLKCQTADPEIIAAHPKQTGIDTIVVFAHNDEWKLVQILTRANPKSRVISAQYHFAANSLNIPLRLPRLEKLAAKNIPHAPIVMISTPGTDAEYVTKLMAQNGLPEPKEYLGKPFLSILKYAGRFMPLKYMCLVNELNDANEPIALHVQSDLLETLSNTGALSQRRFLWLLEKANAKVIFVRRHDKIMQAVYAALMKDRPFRSIWTMPPHLKRTFPGPQKLPLMLALKQLDTLKAAESGLENMLTKASSVHNIYIEDAMHDPSGCITSIAEFAGIPQPKNVKPLEIDLEYSPTKPLGSMANQFKREMIDRLGLHTI